jgi:hypothetical protein
MLPQKGVNGPLSLRQINPLPLSLSLAVEKAGHNGAQAYQAIDHIHFFYSVFLPLLGICRKSLESGDGIKNCTVP